MNTRERQRTILVLSNNSVNFHIINQIAVFKVLSYIPFSEPTIAKMVDSYTRKDEIVLFMPFKEWRSDYPKVKHMLQRQWTQM